MKFRPRSAEPIRESAAPATPVTPARPGECASADSNPVGRRREVTSRRPLPSDASLGPSLAVGPRRLRDLLTPAEVVAMIRRERARADRTHGRFAFVHFQPCGGEGTWQARERRLARIVLRCLRASDEIGRTSSGGLCAILPDTDCDGAWHLLDRVTLVGTRHRTPVGGAVYVYPTDETTRPNPAVRHDATSSMPNDPGESGRMIALAECDPPADGSPSADPAGSTVTHRRSARPAYPMSLLLTRRTPLWKRAIDVAGASAGILLLSPVLIGAAVAVWTQSRLGGDPGPVIFRQTRTGLGGRPFTIYKFRTMLADAETHKAALRVTSEQDGPAFKLTHDPRVTPIGRVLRQLSLDELPQLFNVLKGDMSLVGPRPLPVDEQDGCARWQRQRLDVTPGLTCVWQIDGRGTGPDGQNRVSFDDWMRMDLSYLHRRRLLNDVKILLRTIGVVLLRRGAS